MIQFFYKRKEKDEKSGEEKTYIDSFNPEYAVRGFWASDEVFIVLLADGHEEAKEEPKALRNAKGEVKSWEVKRERNWYVSQISLDKEDAQRFKEITEYTMPQVSQCL
jgi:hypothetical protein